MSFITDNIALAYIRGFEKKEPVDLRELYPACEEEGLKLLKSML